MSETALTPGPWEWEVLDESMMALGTVGYAAMEGNVLFMTRCKACQSNPPDLEHDKYLCNWPRRVDGHVIAAAHEMLEALELQEKADDLRDELLCNHYVPGYDSEGGKIAWAEAVDAAETARKDAIAKARGEVT